MNIPWGKPLFYRRLKDYERPSVTRRIPGKQRAIAFQKLISAYIVDADLSKTAGFHR